MATALAILPGEGILTALESLTRIELKRLFDETAKRAASFVRREYPGVVGVLVHGSVARGEPGPFSDIDLLAVINRGKKPSEFSYFDGNIHVGIGFLKIAELEKEFTDPKSLLLGSRQRASNQGPLRPERHHSEGPATLERSEASAQGRGKISLGHVLLHDRVFRQDEERLAETRRLHDETFGSDHCAVCRKGAYRVE